MSLIMTMFKNCFFILYLSAFLCFSVVFANRAESNTATESGGNQIIVSPINILLDLGEVGTANA